MIRLDCYSLLPPSWALDRGLLGVDRPLDHKVHLTLQNCDKLQVTRVTPQRHTVPVHLAHHATLPDHGVVGAAFHVAVAKQTQRHNVTLNCLTNVGSELLFLARHVVGERLAWNNRIATRGS